MPALKNNELMVYRSCTSVHVAVPFCPRVPLQVATVLNWPRFRKRVCRMKLARGQSQELLRERGIWITEACDQCGKLLGSVRWTRRGELGEWCSRECRYGGTRCMSTPVGVATFPTPNPSAHLRIDTKPAGRPRKHTTNAKKQRLYRNRVRSALALRNSPSELFQNSTRAEAKNRSHVVTAIPAAQTLETPADAISVQGLR